MPSSGGAGARSDTTRAATPAGAMRTRILIEAPQETSDGAGGATVGWAVVASVWAAVTPLVGRERAAAQAVVSDTSHAITMRYRPDVTGRCRVRYGTLNRRVLRIVSVVDVESRHRELALTCAEITTEALS